MLFRALLCFSLHFKKRFCRPLCETQHQVAGWAPNSVFLIMRYSCSHFLLTEAHDTPRILLAVISYSKSKKEENPVGIMNSHPCVWGTTVSVGWNPLWYRWEPCPCRQVHSLNCFLASSNYSVINSTKLEREISVLVKGTWRRLLDLTRCIGEEQKGLWK